MVSQINRYSNALLYYCFQPAYPAFATPRRTALDHPYSSAKPATPASTPPPIEGKPRGRPPKKAPRPASSSEESTPESTPKKKMQSDSEFEPLESSSSSESEPGIQKSDAQVLTDVQKYIVFEDKIEDLLKRCRADQCTKPVLKMEKSTLGTMVHYVCTCLDGHTTHWKSQPQIGRRPVGNISMASSIVLTGNSYSKMHALSECMSLQFLSRSTCQEIQNATVYPIIQEAWNQEERRLRGVIRDKNLVLAGDGRCDR